MSAKIRVTFLLYSTLACILLYPEYGVSVRPLCTEYSVLYYRVQSTLRTSLVCLVQYETITMNYCRTGDPRTAGNSLDFAAIVKLSLPLPLLLYYSGLRHDLLVCYSGCNWRATVDDRLQLSVCILCRVLCTQSYSVHICRVESRILHRSGQQPLHSCTRIYTFTSR